MATKYESCAQTVTNRNSFGGNNWEAVTFTPAVDHHLTQVILQLRRLLADAGTLTASIRATDGAGKPTGPDLCSGTYPSGSVPTGVDTQITFSMGAGVVVRAGTVYAIVLRTLV